MAMVLRVLVIGMSYKDMDPYIKKFVKKEKPSSSEKSSSSELPFAVSDAQKIAKAIKEIVGESTKPDDFCTDQVCMECRYVEDSSSAGKPKNLDEVIKPFLQTCKTGDAIFVYLACHALEYNGCLRLLDNFQIIQNKKKIEKFEDILKEYSYDFPKLLDGLTKFNLCLQWIQTKFYFHVQLSQQLQVRSQR